MNIQCPQCKKIVSWENNIFRPFCSERCKLIDLGDWAMGRNAIPDDHAEESKKISESTTEETED